MGQELYWVIGSYTDVGKTTIASALLRILNRQRCPALGFKPYSATLLTTRIDAMCDPDAPGKGYLFGNDAEDLAKSSPLTGMADVECIVPVQYVCHPHWHNAIIARVGSSSIGTRSCFKNEHQRELIGRPDVHLAFNQNDTPICDMAAVDHIKISTFPANNQEIVERSYQSLASRASVKAIVCEGIGQFLPVWRGAAAVNHILHVGVDRVRLFLDIRLSLDLEQYETLLSSRVIEPRLHAHRSVSAVFPLVPKSQRERVAEDVVENLLHAARVG